MTAPRDPAAGATPARTDAAAVVERVLRATQTNPEGWTLIDIQRALTDALAALRERDAAREDAARLDWLMAHASYVQPANEALHATVVFDVPRGTNLRAAIDAARAATAEDRTP